ncbi:hypothetical protein AD428_07120 [Achromobacter sp. DMS1]|nr:hypothetical protein AD428_07120 [Achromobacter sp. DMS1]
MPAGMSSTSKPASVSVLKCDSRCARALSASKCQSGTRARAPSKANGKSALSAHTISAGAMRCSSDSSCAGAHSVTRKSPLARFSHASPARGARACR